jgi:hypothetical protein
MNSKVLFVFIVTVTVTSCASKSKKEIGDWPLQWEPQSARLTIVGDNEEMRAPYDGNYLSVPGYIFAGGHISLHPGKKRISYSCAQPEDAIQITHYVPSVEFDFKIGHQYELRCKNSQPVIIDVTSEQEE